MASYAKCVFFFFLLVIWFSQQIHARESKMFSKVTKKNTKHHVSVSISPSPAPALAPEVEVVEHGYGLYGRDSYESKGRGTFKPTEKPVLGEEKYVSAEELSKDSENNENFEKGYSNKDFHENGNEYRFPPTTSNPTKTNVVGEEKYVDGKQGMSDTRFLENGKFYYDVNNEYSKGINGNVGNNYNGNGNDKKGMIDTRFLENGKYYYDVSPEGKDVSSYVENEDNKNEDVDMNHGNGYVPQKQGISDTRFMENGKYLYDVQGEKNDMFNSNNNENEQFQQDNQGLIDTRYSNNGKYSYDVNNGNEEHNNHGNGNGYVNEKSEGYNYNENINRSPYDFKSTKKSPNEYDTMEEYDREQGYINPQDGYIP